MSAQTIRVDQFILNKLQPNIDELNLSLISMEENGYDNKPMRDTRDKLNKLMVIDTFLKEYVKGNEEITDMDLSNIMSIAGESSISSRQNAPRVQSVRGSIDINDVNSCENFIRVYLNDEVLTTEMLPPLHEPATLKIYGPKATTSMSVVMEYTGTPAFPPYPGINSVTIEDIPLYDIGGIKLTITNTVCNVEYTTVLEYLVQDTSCTSATFWVGSTSERFSIADEINESSTISTEPNGGSAVPTAELNYAWVSSSSEMTNVLYRNNDIFTIVTDIGDCHIIIMVPVALEIVDVNEDVGGGSLENMTKGIHYEMIPDELVSPGAKFYNCYYFRDLTSTTFTENRTILFTVQQI